MNDTTTDTPVATGGKDKGFTLVELLIVIVILGILATVTVFAVRGITDDAQSTTCKADKKTIDTALEAYYAGEGEYPAALADLDDAVDGRVYLKSVPDQANWLYAPTGTPTLNAYALAGRVDCAGTA